MRDHSQEKENILRNQFPWIFLGKAIFAVAIDHADIHASSALSTEQGGNLCL